MRVSSVGEPNFRREEPTTLLTCHLGLTPVDDLGMLKLVKFTLVASCIGFVAASPTPAPDDISVTARRRTFNCNQDDRLKKIEAQAWADAGAMAAIANEYDSGNQWQPAMNYWMGSDSVKSENFWKIVCKFRLIAFHHMIILIIFYPC